MSLVKVEDEGGPRGATVINFTGLAKKVKSIIHMESIPRISGRKAAITTVLLGGAGLIFVASRQPSPEADASEQGIRQSMWLPIGMLENLPVGDGRSIQVTGATYFRQQHDGSLVQVHGESLRTSDGIDWFNSETRHNILGIHNTKDERHKNLSDSPMERIPDPTDPTGERRLLVPAHPGAPDVVIQLLDHEVGLPFVMHITGRVIESVDADAREITTTDEEITLRANIWTFPQNHAQASKRDMMPFLDLKPSIIENN